MLNLFSEYICTSVCVCREVEQSCSCWQTGHNTEAHNDKMSQGYVCYLGMRTRSVCAGVWSMCKNTATHHQGTKVSAVHKVDQVDCVSLPRPIRLLCLHVLQTLTHAKGIPKPSTHCCSVKLLFFFLSSAQLLVYLQACSRTQTKSHMQPAFKYIKC